MPIDTLMESLPGYAKDIKLNYSTLVRQNTELTPQQLWGTVVASAIATRNDTLTAAALEEGAQHLSAQALEAARIAAALMSMNNIFYRFQHLSSNEKYSTMPARLRMNAMRTHGVEPVDFELWSLAVSAINGCGKCVDSHEKVLREKGTGEELVLAAVRVASVIHAIGAVLDAEKVRQPEPAFAG
jgi:alkyl hydroperoxide reductase subunit D